MKVSLNWLKEYIDIQETPERVGEILTELGLECEGIEAIGGIKGDLQGVVVGEVVSCAKHPDADKLSVTEVNIGQGPLLHIVCGAPNVAAGQKVAVATIGTKLYFSDGKELTIKEGKIRGAVSQGMLCAEDELGIGTDHSGIIVLPADTPIGTPAIEVFKIEKDVVFEIGLTPNRSDAMCHLGVARDIAAHLQIHKNYGAIRVPAVEPLESGPTTLPIEVKVLDTEGCPRYSGVCIAGVTIAESPDWLKKRLAAIGVNTINNVVDITNFILHELGQPLHAFDYDKIEGQQIVVQTVAAGTPFLSLKKNENGDYVSLKLTENDLMICDGQGTPMCIAGVIGNPTEGVSATTTNIFLESAFFNGKRLRRSSYFHNTRTDAAKTFEKGVDPNGTRYALQRAAALIVAVAGGSIASEIIDIYPNPVQNPHIRVNYQRVNGLIGQVLAPEYLHKIFAALDMTVVSADTEGVVLSVPTNKADVLREVDVIEEILRIHGFNNVPIELSIRSAIVPSEKPDRTKVRNTVADFLAANGFNETMALSLSQAKYYEDEVLMSKDNLVFINNTSNIHLNIMRPTMVVSALEMVAHNQNRQTADVRLFEFGKIYTQTADKYAESARLSLTLSGHEADESWLAKPKKVDFFTLKRVVNQLVQRLGLSGYQETPVANNAWAFGVRYHRGAQVLVEFGKVPTKLCRKLDVKQDVYFAEFYWENILKALKNNKIAYEEVSKFPSVRRDLALVLDKDKAFGEISVLAYKTAKKLLKEVNLFDVFEDETKVGAGKKSYAVSFVFEDKEKTLSEKQIEGLVSDLIKAFETKLGASIRQ